MAREWEARTFANRMEAGRALARDLAAKQYPGPVVLALPRGGLPVAAEAARILDAPLDVVLVRKIGLPSQPELAIGAVVDGERPQVVVNAAMRPLVEQNRREFDTLKAAELREIERRRALYLKNRSRVSVSGKTAIVIDDGLATGATARAALKAIRARGPVKLVLAVPVAPRDTLDDLAAECDEVVCLKVPENFFGVGQFYRDFPQLTDEDVQRTLDAFPVPDSAKEPPPELISRSWFL